MAVIDFARHVAGVADAHTVEADAHCTAPVISWMPGQDNALSK